MSSRSSVRMFDEYQTEWVPKARSVCSPLINPLKNRLGFRIIVLPRRTIMTGEWSEPDTTDLPLEYRVRMADCRAALETI